MFRRWLKELFSIGGMVILMLIGLAMIYYGNKLKEERLKENIRQVIKEEIKHDHNIRRDY